MGKRKIRSGYAVMEERRERAAEMATARAKLSPEEQVEVLDQRLGAGVGATRERQKLAAIIGTRRAEVEKTPDRPTARVEGEKAKSRRARDRARGRRGGRRDD